MHAFNKLPTTAICNAIIFSANASIQIPKLAPKWTIKAIKTVTTIITARFVFQKILRSPKFDTFW